MLRSTYILAFGLILLLSQQCIAEYADSDFLQNYQPANDEEREQFRKACVCERILSPVCGSDGNIYSNDCVVRCENYARKLKGLEEITIKSMEFCKENA